MLPKDFSSLFLKAGQVFSQVGPASLVAPSIHTTIGNDCLASTRHVKSPEVILSS